MSDRAASSEPIKEPKSDSAAPLPEGWLSNYPWLTFLLPMIVFMVVGTLEPKPPTDGVEATGSWIGLDIPYRFYPCVYTAKIVFTTLAALLVLPGYRTFPFRVSLWAPTVGVLGVIAWIALATLQHNLSPHLPLTLQEMSGFGSRSAYRPLQELGATPLLAYSFLAVRFFGLAIVIAVVEEFFLRGFLMRYVVSPNWSKLPFGEVDTTALIAGTVFPMLMHPGELIAAMVWFSAVTWLMVKTRNIWDCVAAHAITNLLLGIYVLATGQWWLW